MFDYSAIKVYWKVKDDISDNQSVEFKNTTLHWSKWDTHSNNID